MTPLRQRMVEDMQLRGLSEKTQEAYVRAVRQLAEHYGKSPAQISEEELRQYFLHLKNVKRASRSACTIALCGIKFFYQRTLKREWTTLDLVRSPREKRLYVATAAWQLFRLALKPPSLTAEPPIFARDSAVRCSVGWAALVT